jgi:Uma2 family endonuclease
LSSEEFLRRWDAMPDVKRAELIDGIVYMPSPVSRHHDDCQILLTTWLGIYATGTPGCYPSAEGTWRMGDRNTPQPDAALTIRPEHGGQAGVEGDYHAGAPELIVENAVSSYARDFGPKKRLYERMGVQEYLIAVPRSEELFSFRLTPAGYEECGLAADGIFRSSYFPGLWLDTGALWSLNLQRMNAVLQQGLATPEHAEFAARLAKHTPPSQL